MLPLTSVPRGTKTEMDKDTHYAIFNNEIGIFKMSNTRK